MRLLSRLLLFAVALALPTQYAVAQSAGKTSKKRLPSETAADAATARQVREEFLHAWNAYKQYAWGHDELRPLSKSYRDWYALPLYMTPVDSLDTMIIMGLHDEAESTREFIAKHLTFNCDISVKNFEITIRMLGGL